MCLADIIVSINMTTVVTVSMVQKDFMINTQECTVTGFVNILCFVVSVKAIAVVSLNRYATGFSMRNTFILLALMWIF